MIEISVIIPVYNIEEYLDECLQSVLRQKYRAIEIICINDGSKDNSLNILKKYEKQDKRIKVISQKNLGLGATRNRGIFEAKGKYIYFLDGDDLLNSEYSLDELYLIAESKNLDMVIGNFFNLYQTGEKVIENLIPEKYDNFLLSGKDILKIGLMNKKLFSSSCNRLMKLEYLKRNNLYFIEKKVYFEDVEYNIKSCYSSKKVMYTQKVSMIYRRRAESITTSRISQDKIDSYFIVARLLDEYLKNENIDKTRTLSYSQAATCLKLAFISLLKNNELFFNHELIEVKNILNILLKSSSKHLGLILIFPIVYLKKRKLNE